MAGGFGAGFATLTMLVVLGVVAVALGVVGVGAVAVGRRQGAVPTWLRLLAAALLVPVVAVGGFGVVALADEAAVAAALLVAVVFAPLAVEVGRGRRAGRSWLDALAAAAMAWSVPYLLGAVALFGVNIGAAEVLGVNTAGPRGRDVAWVAVVASGLVVVVGSRFASRRLVTVLGNR